jgi:hypothetical protein
MDFSIINWLAVLVSAASGFAVGGLWYSPILFGKIWQVEAEMTDEKIKSGNMSKIFGVVFILNILIAINMSLFFGGQVGFTDGLMYGAFTGIFFVAAAFGITYLFEHKSLKLWLINAGYQAVIFTVIGGILGIWH